MPIRIAALLLICAVSAIAQSKVDLARQAKNPDFRTFPFFTIPEVASLPGSCVQGHFVNLNTATTGRRLYLCESTNNWVLQGDGGSGGAALPCAVTNTSTVITVPADCGVTVGHVPHSSAAGNFTVASGTGNVRISFQPSTRAVYAVHDVAGTPTGGVVGFGGNSSLPADFVPLWRCPVTSGVVGTCVREIGAVNSERIKAGTGGITLTRDGTTGEVAINQSNGFASNPANCSAGQAAAGVDANGAAEGCFTPSGGGSTFDVGTSYRFLWEAPGTGGVGNFSYNPWYLDPSPGTAAFTRGVNQSKMPACLLGTTSTASGDGATMDGFQAFQRAGLNTETGWTYDAVFSVASATSQTVIMGLWSGNLGEAAVLYQDTASGHTNFQFRTATGFTGGNTDTGLAVTAGKTYRVKIRAVSAGTLGLQVWNLTDGTNSSEVTRTTNLPTTAVGPVFRVVTGTTAARSFCAGAAQFLGTR